jgi:hypothetical protein
MSGRIIILSDNSTGRDFRLPKSEYELQELLKLLTIPLEYTTPLDINEREGDIVYVFHGTNQSAITPIRKNQLVVDVEVIYPMNTQDMNSYEATTLSGTHLFEMHEYKTQIHFLSVNHRKAQYRVGDSVGEFLQRTLSS